MFKKKRSAAARASLAADAGGDLEMQPRELPNSPYASRPVTIDVGSAIYWVPKHLLRSPSWAAIEAGGMIYLPGVSAATGHTLVHFLYTGTYQLLAGEAEGEGEAEDRAHVEFKQALLTFVLASTYELPDLKTLAEERIVRYGKHMNLGEVLDTVRRDFPETTGREFPETTNWCSLQAYLQARAEEQFELDSTFFANTVFVEGLGTGALYRFMTSLLLQMFSSNLARALERQGSSRRDEQEVDEGTGSTAAHCHCCSAGHGTSAHTFGDEIAYEFPNAPCGDVDDVLSLGDSSVPDDAARGDLIEVRSVSDMRENHQDPTTMGEPDSAPVESTLVEELGMKLDAALEPEFEDVKAPDTEGLLEESVVPEPPTEESWAEPPTEESWGETWGIPASKKKKKSKKGYLASGVLHREAAVPRVVEETISVMEEPIPEGEDFKQIEDPTLPEHSTAPEAPEPESIAEPEPIAEPEQEPKPDLDVAAEEAAPLPASIDTLCPRRSIHLMTSDRWKSCEQCHTMLSGIAVQLAKENLSVLL